VKSFGGGWEKSMAQKRNYTIGMVEKKKRKKKFAKGGGLVEHVPFRSRRDRGKEKDPSRGVAGADTGNQRKKKHGPLPNG